MAIDIRPETRDKSARVASVGRMLMVKSILAVTSAAALLAPLPVAAEEPMMKLAGMLRCAAVYQVTSERAPKDSEAQLTAGRHFLQYYMIMLALAENKPDDKFDAKTLKTLFEAENAIANSDAVLAPRRGQDRRLRRRHRHLRRLPRAPTRTLRERRPDDRNPGQGAGAGGDAIAERSSPERGGGGSPQTRAPIAPSNPRQCSPSRRWNSISSNPWRATCFCGIVSQPRCSTVTRVSAPTASNRTSTSVV